MKLKPIQYARYEQLVALTNKLGRCPTIAEIRDNWGYGERSNSATGRMLDRLKQAGYVVIEDAIVIRYPRTMLFPKE